MNINRSGFATRRHKTDITPNNPIPVSFVTSGQVQEITFVAGSDFTVSAGVAGDVETIYLPVTRILGAYRRIGSKFDTSLSLGGAIATTFDSEVPFISTDGKSADTSNLSNGEFMVDYEAGIFYGKRADTGTTGTVTCSVEVAGGGGFSSADSGFTEVRAAAVVTASYVAGTVYKIPEGHNQLTVFSEITLGNATSVELKVEFSPDNSTFGQEHASLISGGTSTESPIEHTYDADGNAPLTMPIPSGMEYVKVSYKGTTGSDFVDSSVAGSVATSKS